MFGTAIVGIAALTLLAMTGVVDTGEGWSNRLINLLLLNLGQPVLSAVMTAFAIEGDQFRRYRPWCILLSVVGWASSVPILWLMATIFLL